MRVREKNQTDSVLLKGRPLGVLSSSYFFLTWRRNLSKSYFIFSGTRRWASFTNKHQYQSLVSRHDKEKENVLFVSCQQKLLNNLLLKRIEQWKFLSVRK